MTGNRRSSFKAAFKHRDFRYLFSAFAISSAGDWVYGVAVLAFIFSETRSPAWVAAASMIRLVPHVVLSTFGGVVADRFERWRVLLYCDTARAILMLCLALVAAFSGPAILALVIVFLSTAAGTPYSPALAAMNPAVVGERDLAAANAVTSTVEHTAIVVGPAVAGVLLFLGSPAVAFALNGATFALSALLVAAVRTRSKARPAQKDVATSHRVLEGFRAIKRSPEVFVLVSLIVGATLIYGMEFVLLVLVSERFLGTGAGGVSFLMLAVGVGGLIGASLSNRLGADVRPKRTLMFATVLFGIPLVGLAFLREPPFAYALMTLQGASTIVLEVVAITMLQRSISRDVLARVFGVLESLAVGGILLGSLMAPVLVALFGLQRALLVAGAIVPFIGLLVSPRLRLLDRRAIERMLLLAPKVKLLSSLSIFAGAQRQSLETIALGLTEEELPEGSIVMEEGETADDLYVVEAGTLEVYSTGEVGGKPVLVNSLAAGDFFGEIGVLEGIPRTATVHVTSDCKLWRIRGEDFLDVVNQSPSLSGTIMDGIVGRLANSHPSYRPTASAVKDLAD